MIGYDDGSLDAQREAAMNNDIDEANARGARTRSDRDKAEKEKIKEESKISLPPPSSNDPPPAPKPSRGKGLRLAGKLIIGLGIVFLIYIWGFSPDTFTLPNGETETISRIPATFMALALMAMPFIPRIIRTTGYVIAGLMLFNVITVSGDNGTEFTTQNLTVANIAIILIVGLVGYLLPRLLMKEA